MSTAIDASLKALSSLFNPVAAREEKAKTSKTSKTSKKKDRTVSDARRLDYRYAEENPQFLFIKGNSVWTGVILSTTTEDFTSISEDENQVRQQVAMWQALSSYLATSYKDDEFTFKLDTAFVPADVSRWKTEYMSRCWNPSQLFRELVEEKVVPHIADTTPERRQYLTIRLGELKAATQLDPVSLLLDKSATVAEEIFSNRDLEPFRRKAAGVASVLGQYGAVPMDRVDLSWLIRKPLLGHFPADNKRGYERTRPWRAGAFDEIVNVECDVVGDYIRHRNPHPENGLGDYSYSTSLIVETTDPIIHYGGAASWGKALRQMERPVDVSWRGTVLSAERWRKESKARIGLLEDEANTRAEVNANHSEAFEQVLEQATILKGQQEVSPQPVMVSQLRFSISAPSPDELTETVSTLQSRLGDGVKLERRVGVQGFLLEERLPGDMTPPKTRIPYLGRQFLSKETGAIDVGTRWSDVDAVAFSRLDSSPSVGDEVEYTPSGIALGWRGFPIGYCLSNGSLVHFDPMVQMARNRGAGIAILGSSGGGKSSLALTLFFWASESGVTCYVIDPKNDFEKFAYYLSFGSQVNDPDFDREAAAGTLGTPDSKFQPTNPQFWADTSIISLGNGAPGMLDPWAITDTYAEGEEQARRIVELIVPDPAERDLVDVAFQNMRAKYEDVDTGAVPALADLSGYLLDETEYYDEILHSSSADQSSKMEARDRKQRVQRVIDRLDRAQSRQYGRLMFGRRGKHQQPLRFRDVRRTIITLYGMDKPDESVPVEEWGESARDAAAALLSVIRKLNQAFAEAGEENSPWNGIRRYRPQLLFIDEAYFVTALKAGRAMLKIFMRQGRSKSFGVIFISQQAKDLNGLEEENGEEEASQNQVVTKFIFRQGGVAEARDALRLLKPSVFQSKDSEVVNIMARRLMSVDEGGELSTGQCALSDVDKRVSTVVVDRMFEELIEAAETNPQASASVRVNVPSPRGAEWRLDTSLRDWTRTGVVTKEVGDLREAVERYEYGEYASVMGETQLV